MYEITVTHEFAAGHAIRLPDGSVEPMHDHDWSVDVTVGVNELDGTDMVMDFHALVKCIGDLLAKVSGRCVNDVPPFADASGKAAINPTAERVAWWLGTEVAGCLGQGVRLVSVTVGEAPNCRATYRPQREGAT